MPMLKAEHLSFSYAGRGSQETLKDLSLEIHPGECLAVVGRNGSGKSTLLSLLAGSLKPGKGSVEREGKLGYVPQGNALLEDLSVWENVVFFAALGGVSKKDIPDPLPLGISSFRRKKIRALSGGMQKRVSIACALAARPQILLLDEPCAALDIFWKMKALELFLEAKRAGVAILYVGHDFSEILRLSDRILFLDHGRQLFQRPLSQLPSSPMELEELARSLLSEDVPF